MLKLPVIIFGTLILSLHPEIVMLLDDVPMKDATIIFGNKTLTNATGHFYIPIEEQTCVEVVIEGQHFDIPISNEYDFHLYRFYHCYLNILDSSYNKLADFEVYLNGRDLGSRSQIVAPSGGSLLKIKTPHMEYSMSINVSAPTRLSITLPVSDLNVVLTNRYGKPVQNQSFILRDMNSIEYQLTTDDRGFARLSSLPHGVYTMSIGNEERFFVHNSSAKQRFALDLIRDLSVEVENPYLLFPTRVAVNLLSPEGFPLINSYVTLRYDGSQLGGFTDGSGSVYFYISPSISMCSEISVTASGLTKYIKVCKDPAPLIALLLLVGSLIVYISKTMKIQLSGKHQKPR